MDSLYILIPIAVVFVAVAISAFLWAVNSRQYDDLDAESQRILFDDDVEVRVNTQAPEAGAGESERPAGKHHGSD